jgi:hypothetical protein
MFVKIRFNQMSVGQNFLSLTRVMVLALALAPTLAPTLAHAAASARPTSRVQTINSVESAPLAVVSRSFTRLETSLGDSFDPDLLSYRIRHPGDSLDDALEETMKTLLVNIAGGPIEASVTNLEMVNSEPRQVTLALDTFAHDLDSEVIDGLSAALRSALARPDLKLYSARVVEKSEDLRFLLVFDEETQELLVMSLSIAR